MKLNFHFFIAPADFFAQNLVVDIFITIRIIFNEWVNDLPILVQQETKRMKRDCPELDRLERVHKLQEKAERPQFKLRDTSLVSKRPKMVHKRDSSLVKRMASRLRRFALKQIDRSEIVQAIAEYHEELVTRRITKRALRDRKREQAFLDACPPRTVTFGP